MDAMSRQLTVRDNLEDSIVDVYEALLKVMKATGEGMRKGRNGMDDGLYDGDGELGQKKVRSEGSGTSAWQSSRWFPRPAASSLRVSALL